jgi:cytochrome c oxidase subunit 1
MGISALYGMLLVFIIGFKNVWKNVEFGLYSLLGTAICAYGVFFYTFYRFNWFAKTLLYYTNFPLFDDLQNVNVLITTFALIGGAFQLIFLYNFFSSIFYGKKSVMNP